MSAIENEPVTAGSQNMEWTQKQIQAEKQNFDMNKGFIYNNVTIQDDEDRNCEIQQLWTKSCLWIQKVAWSTMYKDFTTLFN